MRIILSPAKKMVTDTDSLPWETLPVFLDDARRILDRLRGMEYSALKELWNCNESIAALNAGRLRHCDLGANLTPAVLSYQGIQYQYMAPGVLERKPLGYIQTHLRILSGFYGVLRPFDGVVPYRLEMQARLDMGAPRGLYGFWGSRLAASIYKETDFVLNLASREYSRCVEPYTPAGARFHTCVFGQLLNGRVVEKGTLCKMARGEMVRWLAENNITSAGELQYFNGLGYTYAKSLSDESHHVFIKEA